MEPEIISIEVTDPENKITCSVYVEKLGENLFRTYENEYFMPAVIEDDAEHEFTKGTEFETRINEKGKHEIIKITKPSPYITTDFVVSEKFAESLLPLLGKEIEMQGGYWQVDMGGLLSISLLPDSLFNIEEAIQKLTKNATDKD